jgi:hypothetical protein
VLVAAEIMHTTRTYARNVSIVRREWLKTLAPEAADRLKESEQWKGKRKGRGKGRKGGRRKGRGYRNRGGGRR